MHIEFKAVPDAASAQEQGPCPWALAASAATKAGAVGLLVAFGALTPRGQAQCAPAGWVPVPGVAGTQGDIRALAVLPGGDVVAGGLFTAVGGVAANSIARYHPATNTWSGLGSGVTFLGSVHCVAAFPGAGGGDVIAGGQFSTAGGVNIGYGIARYSPATNTWSALGSGISNIGVVQSLSVLPGGDLIAGGQFMTAGGVPANNIARYSPATSSWSALGSGINGSAVAMVVLAGGDVIVGGVFDTAGGMPANCIARYSPATTAWSALGSGLTITGGTAQVHALAVLPGAGDGDVIAGGVFTTAGGVSIGFNIARYSTSTGTWSALGSGINDVVRTVAVLPGAGGGDLIAGGHFVTASGVPANRIARYSPAANTWSALGSGTDNRVLVVATLASGDELIAGGTFTAAGGAPAGHVARYRFGSACYGNCDCSTGPQVLNVNDFVCFQAQFAGGEPFADCDHSGVLNVNDFVCFQAAFAAGCP